MTLSVCSGAAPSIQALVWNELVFHCYSNSVLVHTPYVVPPRQ
jgi:hypothetical protein